MTLPTVPTRIPVFATALLVSAAALTLTACSDRSETTPGSTMSEGVAPPRLDPSQLPSSGAGLLADQRPVSRGEIESTGFTWGSDDAPIHVVEFSDYGCGYCRQFHLETFSPLFAEFVESGRVHWRFIPFNVGMFPNADRALSSGLCGGDQGKVLEMGDALFERQREWKATGDVSGVFEESARAAGLDMDAWTACVEEDRFATEALNHTNMARRLGIRGTPTFFVDGYPIPGALPLETFREVFESILEEVAPEPGA